MTQPKINLTILKKHLKTCSQEELINDIAELYKRFQPVKDYYQIQLAPQDETQVAAKYKKIIEDQFFPTRGYGRAKLSVAKKAMQRVAEVSSVVATASRSNYRIQKSHQNYCGFDRHHAVLCRTGSEIYRCLW